MLSNKVLLNLLPLFLIILLGFVLRFIWIDKVPNAVGGDELTYVVNARSMFISGTDISGTWNPLTSFIFQYPSYTLPQAELPYFLIAPFVGFFGFSLFSVRIIFVLLSALSVPLIYLITKTLFNKNTYLAIRKNYKSEKFKYQNVNFAGCDRTIDVTKKQISLFMILIADL